MARNLGLGARGRRLLALTLLACSWSGSAGAEEDAATRAAARKLAEDGVAALQTGDAAAAAQKLEKAFQTLQVPSIALWSGRALAKQGRLVEAAERFREATRLPASGDAAVQEQAKAEAQKELDQLQPRVPNLVVTVEGADAAAVSVTIDGQALPASLLGEDRPTNPGRHRVVARRADEQQVAEVSVAEGERKPVTLRFGAGAAATPSDPATQPLTPSDTANEPASSGGARRTLAFVALGVGGAGLALGGVTGALAIGKKNALDGDHTNCAAGQCTYAVEDKVNSLRTFRTVSTVGFVAGGVLAATGVVLLLTSPKQEQIGNAPRMSVGMGLGHVQLRGQF